MCNSAIEIETSAAYGRFPPVESTVRNAVLKSTIQNEGLPIARIPRPICRFKHLAPSLLRFHHASLIDQRVDEWSGVRHLDGQAELALAIPNRECGSREILGEEEIDCSKVVIGLGG